MEYVAERVPAGWKCRKVCRYCTCVCMQVYCYGYALFVNMCVGGGGGQNIGIAILGLEIMAK